MRSPLLALLLLLGAIDAIAYSPETHQRLTFIAAQQFNQCATQLDLPVATLTPLQVRYIARTNVQQAQGNFFSRLVRWNYYNREAQKPRSFLWLIDTRFHEHFTEVSNRIDAPKNEVSLYRDLGRIVNYVQTVTSPAHAVPVYTTRWWRLSLSDRFDDYPLDAEAVAAEAARHCEQLLQPGKSYTQVLRDAADATLDAVQAPIEGLPATWESFWRLDKRAGNFGDYGRAGNNFGRATEFRCGDGERCVLLQQDPLYAAFAKARHVEAVLATMRVLRTAAALTTKP